MKTLIKRISDCSNALNPDAEGFEKQRYDTVKSTWYFKCIVSLALSFLVFLSLVDFYSDVLVTIEFYRAGRTLWSGLLIGSLSTYLVLEAVTAAGAKRDVEEEKKRKEKEEAIKKQQQEKEAKAKMKEQALQEKKRNSWRSLSSTGSYDLSLSRERRDSLNKIAKKSSFFGVRIFAATIAWMLVLPPVIVSRTIWSLIVGQDVAIETLLLLPTLSDALPKVQGLDALEDVDNLAVGSHAFTGHALWIIRHAQLVEIATETLPQVLVQMYAYTLEFYRKEGSNKSTVNQNSRRPSTLILVSMILSTFASANIMGGFVMRREPKIKIKAIGVLFFTALLILRAGMIVAWFVEYGYYANIVFAFSVLYRWILFGDRVWRKSLNSIRQISNFLIVLAVSAIFPIYPSVARFPRSLIDRNDPHYPLNAHTSPYFFLLLVFEFLFTYIFILSTERKGRPQLDSMYCIVFGLVPLFLSAILLTFGGLRFTPPVTAEISSPAKQETTTSQNQMHDNHFPKKEEHFTDTHVPILHSDDSSDDDEDVELAHEQNAMVITVISHEDNTPRTNDNNTTTKTSDKAIMIPTSAVVAPHF